MSILASPKNCDPCLNNGVNTRAVTLCEDCSDYLCKPCDEFHKRFKLTKNHNVSELKERKRSIFHQKCYPCKYSSVFTNAKYVCTVCEEHLCYSCTEVHKQFKPARRHVIVPISETPLYKRKPDLECGVCEDASRQKAIAFCTECMPNELFCSDCLYHHTRIKTTRNHSVNYNLEQYEHRSTGTSTDSKSTRQWYNQWEIDPVSICTEPSPLSCCSSLGLTPDTQLEEWPAKLKEEDKKQNHKSSDFQYCGPCLNNGENIKAVKFCEDCDDYLCKPCKEYHKRFKFTKNHNVLESKERNRSVFHQKCDLCKFSSVITNGKYFCTECEENLCYACTEVHKQFKATRGHVIVPISENPLYKRKPGLECGVCEEASRQKAIAFCTECVPNELFCSDCLHHHRSIKTTRHHSVNYHLEQYEHRSKGTSTDSKSTSVLNKRKPDLECGVCEEASRQRAIAFCTECVPNELFCSDCLHHHTSIKTTRHHSVNYHLEQYEHRSTGTSTGSKSSRSIGTGLKEKNLHKPGKPVLAENPKADSVQLIWNQPEASYKSYQYQIRFRSPPSDKWTFYDEQFTENAVILKNLKSDAAFIFQVRMVDNDCEGPYSDQSDVISTKQSAANHLIGLSEIMPTDEGSAMTKRKLPLEENKKARNENSKTRMFYLGNPRPVNDKEKTLLFVGATGSGKSTLVDGFINYILGVNWCDPFRFTIVDLEEDEKEILHNQAMSQTQWITTYSINHIEGSRVDYKLNIIDTPGFGDTRGYEQDQQIVDQIRQLFSASDETGVACLDAVCFLTKAPDARLTPTQRYIFNAILSLFGQDIAGNITVLVTFADGKTPPVVHALKEANLPHDVFFPFNNSALFAHNSGHSMSSISPMFWDMGSHSFDHFFKHLESMETKSLTLTKEVLEQRKTLEITIENLSPLISTGLHKLEETREEIRILEHHKTEIEANKDFQYTVTETKQTQKDLPRGQHVTNCLNCNVTCHKECKIPKDEDKHGCWAMDPNGNCTQCVENCNWKQHANTPYIFEFVQEDITKTYAEKLEKYRAANDEKMTHEKVIYRMINELDDLENEIFANMDIINKCNNTLKEIALRPNPLSRKEHIDILIESEKQEKRMDFRKRIASLMELRKKCTVTDDVDRFQKDLKTTRNHSILTSFKKDFKHKAIVIANIIKNSLKFPSN